jgi:4-hydroxy-tetrahydrodipicolinate reductase
VTDIVIAGIRGRMGRALLQLLHEGAPCAAGLRLVGGIGRTAGEAAAGAAPAGGAPAGDAPAIATPDRAASLVASAAVVIDFSGAAGTHGLLQHCGDALRGRALVVGSTGLDESTRRLLDDVTRHTAVLTAANFSVGVNLLQALVAHAAAALPAEQYDIEVVEAHHGRKLDAPSGTALALAEAAARGRGAALQQLRRDGRSGETGRRPVGEIGLHAVRGGGVVGEHQVLFLGERERIELRHEALDRALFAEGALVAAQWLAGRGPGRYSMSDVLGIRG